MTNQTWKPETNHFPTTTETVHVEFVGLMAFCPGHDSVLRRDRCEVGIINNAPNHDLVVKMWKNSNLVHTWGPKPANTLRNQTFSLRIIEPSENDGVSFFQRHGTFAKNDDDERDFRWIVDFENEEFFGRPDRRVKLRKDPRFTTPRFNVYDGVLYTFCRSGCKFKRETPQSTLSLGRIAKRQACHLHLTEGQTAQIDLPGLESSNAILTADNHYDILISNLCYPVDAQKCKDAENDFHYYYQTYEAPTGREHFDLLLDTSLPCPRHSCVARPLDDDATRGSDRAPCAASGFGNGGGLDYPF